MRSSLSIEETCEKLRELFDLAVRRNLAEGILLSGGLDTSVVTVTARKYTDLTGITVVLRNAPDLEYATLIAHKFHLNHVIIRIDENDAVNAVDDVVRAMKSFDPMEVRNDATILIGLRAAKRAGVTKVFTGDASDELFAGYSFLFKKSKQELAESLDDMWRCMRFASILLAKNLGMEARLPFLDEDVKNFAMSLSPDIKVKEERGQLYGKWILRKAFERLLPEQIVWRVKMPIEQGSGTSTLPTYFNSKISDDEFSRRRKMCHDSDGVQIADKEHLFYYDAYKRHFGIPRGTGEGGKVCRGCSAYLPDDMTFCTTCGTRNTPIFTLRPS